MRHVRGVVAWMPMGILVLAGTAVGHAEESAGVELKQAVLYGASGNQRGTALSFYNASELYLSGADEAVLGGQSLGLHYRLASNGTPALDWAFRWPSASNRSGNVNSEVFDGVVGTRAAVFFAGRSWSQTADGVGDKEHKSVLAGFPLTGSTGPGVGGALWVAKPNFFSYRGNESFLAVAFGPDRSGSAHYLYASGYAQTNGANNTAILAQYQPTDGTLRWSRVLGNTGWFMSSFGSAVTTLNGEVYVAGMTHYPYLDATALRIALWKYDDAGNPLWVRSHPGFIPGWRGETALIHARRYQSTAGDVYVVGAVKNGPAGGTDALMLKYDEAGTLLWSQTWGGAADDLAYSVTANDHARTPPEDQRLYVTGTTASFGAGKQDVFLLEVNPATGAILSRSYYGGKEDDIGWGAQRIGSSVYVVGETRSFAEGGNLIGQADVLLLQYAIKPAQTTLAVSIDIKPGSAENSINPNSRGKIPVAILSGRGFAAPEAVKQSSLTFGRSGNEPSLAFCASEDVNGDGQLDLMCHLETARTAFQDTDSQGILHALTTSGRALKGIDSIRLVPALR